MQHPWLKSGVALLVVAALFAVLPACANESPFAGHWKVLDVSNGNETALVLLQIAEKDGKPHAKVLAAPLLGAEVAIENLNADAKSLRFDLKYASGTYHIQAYIPKADAKSKGVRGTITVNNQLHLAQFNKTDDTELSADDAENTTAEGEQLAKALELEDAKEKQTALKEIFEQHGDKPAVYVAAELLLQGYAKEGAKEELLRGTAERFVKIGALFGPDAEIHSIQRACRTLRRTEKGLPVAVELARRAEKALTKDDPPARSLAALKLIAAVLRRTGKTDEAREIAVRIDKLEEPLDAAYEKTAVPFKPEPYKGRRSGSTRVAVVELFTGAYCPPCVAADVAFDAALQTYKPKDVLFLQYHLHIPQPDRLTNPDTERRAKYYDRAVQGVPTAFLNGKVIEALGGGKDDGNKSYDTLRAVIDNALEREVGGLLSLSVIRKGDTITLDAEVTQLKNPGEKVKLRFVLIEEVARYPGGNGQRLHHHVVRALPGGSDGFALTEIRARRKVTVDLAALKTSLDDDLTATNLSANPFVDDEYPLDFKHLKVVALIQDDAGKEILQAVQKDVPDTK
jgi:hypothetical protein